MGSRSPREWAIFGGCPAHWDALWVCACGVRGKRDNLTLNNGTECDAAFCQNILWPLVITTSDWCWSWSPATAHPIDYVNRQSFPSFVRLSPMPPLWISLYFLGWELATWKVGEKLKNLSNFLRSSGGRIEKLKYFPRSHTASTLGIIFD